MHTLSYFMDYNSRIWICTIRTPAVTIQQSGGKRDKKLIKKDPLARELASFLKEKADSMVVLPQLTYDLNKYGNILYTSRAYVTRLGTLSLAYRLYGEQKYLDAVNNTLLWICDYKDWDPAHFLDTAEMTTAVAIAYDWLLMHFLKVPDRKSKKVSTRMQFPSFCANMKKEALEVGPKEKLTGMWYVIQV